MPEIRNTMPTAGNAIPTGAERRADSNDTSSASFADLQVRSGVVKRDRAAYCRQLFQRPCGTGLRAEGTVFAKQSCELSFLPARSAR